MLMPMDNPSTIPSGGAVSFPQDGPSTSPLVGGTARFGPDVFVLGTTGVYRVSFQVPITEAGQLVIFRNGTELPYTRTGRAGGTSAIFLTTLVTGTAGDMIEVRNAPGGNSLTVTPLAGGTVATLLIELVKAA